MENRVLDIPIYNADSDAQSTNAVIRVNYDYIQSLALANGLQDFIEDSVGFYACSDGPVLIIWGGPNSKNRIIGITPNLQELREKSAIRRAWEEHKREGMTIKDVHTALLESLNRLVN